MGQMDCEDLPGAVGFSAQFISRSGLQSLLGTSSSRLLSTSNQPGWHQMSAEIAADAVPLLSLDELQPDGHE